MAGFVLKNTLSDNGGVTSGICKMDDQNNLTEVVETKNIVKTADGAEVDGTVIDTESLVPVNMWGLTPEFLDMLEAGFAESFETEVPTNPLKAEFLIPTFIGELLDENHPNFNTLLDPKCDWALQNLGEFPVEVNRAPYEMLLRVPGIGVKSAMRIVAARKQTALRFEDLKKMGVVLKRAVYFITCSGRMMYPVQIHEDAIAAQLVSEEKRKQWQLSQSGLYRQMSLFDDFHMAQV